MKSRVKDFAYTVRVREKQLLALAEKIDSDEFSFYRSWEEPKTDAEGKPRFADNGEPLTRSINAPVLKLKLVQRKILNQALYSISLPDFYFGGVRGKDAVQNARHHQGNKFFFLTDLKDFYPSISFENVEMALRKEGFYPDVARLITRLCTVGGCVPQGCPTSSFLASLVIHHLAGDMWERYLNEGFRVSVYVDDITISSPQNFKPRVPSIINEIRARGLKINFDKTEFRTYNPVVTGVRVLNNGIAPPKHAFERAQDSSRSDESRRGHFNRIHYIKKLAKRRNS